MSVANAVSEVEGGASRYVIVPPVIETVTGTWIVSVPSETAIVVEPLMLVPMPIDVATKTPVDAGLDDVETAIDAGATVTIVVSLLVAVNVPVKPFSVTENCWVPFTPPNAMLAGFALSGIGVGDGVGVGVGVGVAPLVAVVVVLDEEVAGFTPPPPQPASTAKPTMP